ncbi:MAG: radical SAM protein [Planctomycetes bacterium]|nr:radical SAM protein [Planctomycetota bacterium]
MEIKPEVAREYPGLSPYRLKSGVVYGPVTSRRQGQSVGINLLPADLKVCSFDCVYCQCGWTDVTDPAKWDALAYPSLEQIGREVEEAFAQLRAAGCRVDSITLSGNGEPTMHPRLGDAIDLVQAARARHFPRAETSVLTNGTYLGKVDVRRAIDRLDERIVKLDAGTEPTLKRIDLPLLPFALDRLEEWVKDLRDVTLQSYFSQGRIDNTVAAEVDAWIERVGRIRPRYVQLYSLARIPPLSGLERVARSGLDAIARRLRERTGVEGRVY